jgi:plastocyanin
MRRFAIAAFTVAAVTFVPAVAASATTRTDPAVAAGSVTRVKMVDGPAFRPQTVHIARGDVVKWVNRDDITHTTTSSSWDSGNLAPGERFKRRFRRAGSFSYHCSIHPNMTGTVVVG